MALSFNVKAISRSRFLRNIFLTSIFIFPPLLDIYQPEFFGRKIYGTAIGMMSTIGGIFSAIAPIVGGLVYDLFETYRISFAVGSILVFIAIPLLLSIKNES